MCIWWRTLSISYIRRDLMRCTRTGWWEIHVHVHAFPPPYIANIVECLRVYSLKVLYRSTVWCLRVLVTSPFVGGNKCTSSPVVLAGRKINIIIIHMRGFRWSLQQCVYTLIGSCTLWICAFCDENVLEIRRRILYKVYTNVCIIWHMWAGWYSISSLL